MVCLNASYTLLAGGFGSVITTLSFNPLSPNITVLANTDAGVAPSWLTLHPTLDIVYAVNEAPEGALVAFAIAEDATLTRVDEILTGGNGPTHLELTDGGQEIVASNFGDGTSSFISLSPEGRFSGTPQVLKYNAPESHPHQTIPYNNELLVPDLGADMIWRLSKNSNGEWTIRDFQSVPTGSGPRHGVVKNDNLYIAAEKTNRLLQQSLPSNSASNTAAILSSLSILPPDIVNTSTFAAAECLSSGDIIYVTNRNVGDTKDPRGDAIAIFDASNSTGLSFVGHVFTGLNNLRGAALFGLDNEYLIVGSNDDQGGGIAVFKRSPDGRELLLLSRNTEIGATSSFVWI